MDASPVGDLTGSQLITVLFALIVSLVAWIFNRELNRLNHSLNNLYERTNNHSARLSSLDGKTENE